MQRVNFLSGEPLPDTDDLSGSSEVYGESAPKIAPSRGRNDTDFAIEFALYLAASAECLLDTFNAIRAFDNDDERDTINDRVSDLRSAIYEFRKRAARCGSDA